MNGIEYFCCFRLKPIFLGSSSYEFLYLEEREVHGDLHGSRRVDHGSRCRVVILEQLRQQHLFVGRVS